MVLEVKIVGGFSLVLGDTGGDGMGNLRSAGYVIFLYGDVSYMGTLKVWHFSVCTLYFKTNLLTIKKSTSTVERNLNKI